MTAIDANALGLPQLFTPAEAAEILRSLGLSEMTECALRTRAYRRQVPFHLNGRRIRFTIADLREIVEGQAQRPRPPDPETADPPAQALRPAPRTRRPPVRAAITAQDAWRARRPLAT
jgi:hypothetical protein